MARKCYIPPSRRPSGHPKDYTNDVRTTASPIGCLHTYHRFAAVLPSRVSVPLLSHSPPGYGSLGVVVVELTASRNRLATEHICQCSGMDAGGSTIRVLTGVRSPGKTKSQVGVRNQQADPRHTMPHVDVDLLEVES